MISEQKRRYLREVFGDQADEILKELDERGKALEEKGITYKAAAQSPAHPMTLEDHLRVSNLAAARQAQKRAEKERKQSADFWGITSENRSKPA